MERPKYYSLEESLGLIEEPNRSKCIALLRENKNLFERARGSGTKHQAWEGGYLDHVNETMNLAILFYQSLSSTGRSLDFTLSDTLLVLFLHDLEKPYKQIRGSELGLIDSPGRKRGPAIRDFKEQLFRKYNFKLTDEQLNAIRNVEGENEIYNPTKRVMNELAAFCHMCDIWSARGWHDFPKKDDSWRV